MPSEFTEVIFIRVTPAIKRDVKLLCEFYDLSEAELGRNSFKREIAAAKEKSEWEEFRPTIKKLSSSTMSVPIKYCFLVEAADNAESFTELHPIMKRNLDGGHFSVMPCNHDPPCRDLTDDESADLMIRFRQPVDG